VKGIDVFRVVKPGFFSSVQDLGRFGFQRFGVPVSGAMDKHAFVCANVLVGNTTNDACLEVTLIGPELESLNPVQVAVAGADFAVLVNGEVAPMWETLNVKKGDTITFCGSAESGCRAYLAVRGGIDVPVVLKSRSTYVRGGFGGYEGHGLRVDDVLQAFAPPRPLKEKRALPAELVPKYESEFTVDVVLGPQEDMFTVEGDETFLSQAYTVTTESDRMGYRLDGAVVGHRGAAEIITDALIPGAVQVPGSGKPIVLMMDAQTTGGYPKIATVTTPDVSRLGQAKPDDKIRFRKVSLTEARARYLQFHASLSQLEDRFVELQAP
jgi:antagonist of KipI